MYSPEDPTPASWTKEPDGEMSPENTEADLDSRHAAAKEYVGHHLAAASEGLETAAMSLLNVTPADLNNPNFIADVHERMRLSSDDSARLDAFIKQLQKEDGWSAEPGSESATVEASSISETVVPEAAAVEATVEAEPVVYESVDAAAEAMRENSEAMADALDNLEPIEDDPYQTLENFFAVLDTYAINMQSSSKVGEILRGIPVSLTESNVPEEEYDEWGGRQSRATSGSINGLRRRVTVDAVTKEGFSADAVTGDFVHPAIAKTLNRLFASSL